MPTKSQFRIRELVPSVYLPAFLLIMGQGIILPIIPSFVEGNLEVGSLFFIALAISAQDIGLVFTDIPAGILTARFGPRRVLILGVFMFGVAGIISGLSTEYWMFFLARVMAGMAFALWSISRFSYMANKVPSLSRGRASALFGGVVRMAFILGPVIGGFMAENIDIRLPFFIQGGLAGLTLVLLLVFRDRISDEFATMHRHGFMDGIKSIAQSDMRRVLPATVVAIVLQFLRKFRELISVWGQQVGLSESEIGIIQSSAAAADFSMFPVSGIVMDRFGRRFNVLPAFLFLATGLTVLAFADAFWILLAATTLMGLGNGITSGFLVTLSQDLAPADNPSGFIGAWRLLSDVGGSLSPLGVGSIAQLTSLSVAAFTGAGIGIFGALLVIFVMRETAKPAPPQATNQALHNPDKK